MCPYVKDNWSEVEFPKERNPVSQSNMCTVKMLLIWCRREDIQYHQWRASKSKGSRCQPEFCRIAFHPPTVWSVWSISKFQHGCAALVGPAGGAREGGCRRRGGHGLGSGWVGPPSPFPCCTHSCSETLAKCLELGAFSMRKIDFKIVLQCSHLMTWIWWGTQWQIGLLQPPLLDLN